MLIRRLVLLAMAFTIFTNLGFAQTGKTTRGYFCGYEEGDGAIFGIRAGTTTINFEIESNVPFKEIGFKKGKYLWSTSIGSELVVRYTELRTHSGLRKIARSATFTGKSNDRIRRCIEGSG